MTLELDGKPDAAMASMRDFDVIDDNRQLRTALTSRVIIEQAKGFVLANLGTNAEEAFSILRNYTRRNHLKIRNVCEAVVNWRLDLMTVVSAGTPPLRRA